MPVLDNAQMNFPCRYKQSLHTANIHTYFTIDLDQSEPFQREKLPESDVSQMSESESEDDPHTKRF